MEQWAEAGAHSCRRPDPGADATNEFIVSHLRFMLQTPMPAGEASTIITPPPNKSSTEPRTRFCGLLRRQVFLVPTWRGWAVLLLLAASLIFVVGRQLCAFLTMQNSVPGGVLVVEGWVPAYAARAAVEEFRRHPYLGIYVTGEPIEEGNPFIGFGNYAELTVEKLKIAGAPADRLHAVPAPFVGKDRTYTTAATLKKQLETEGVSTAKINLISLGPHSRRSRLLYEFAFGSNSQVGVIAITDREFDPDHWWRSSNGVRTVISEAIAYGYARFIFRPSAQ
jgi:hypothetical protein